MYRFYGWERADVRDARGMTPRDYYDILSGLWAADTCAPRMRGDWTPENPTLGQCSITAFLMQDIYGGDVFGVPLPDGAFHCFNAADGCVFDLTSEQFGGAALNYAGCPEQRREEHFAKAEKLARYGLLRGRLARALRDRAGCDADLRDYDGQCVRLTELGGEAFDGVCAYSGPEYNEHEYGRGEAALQIERLLFYEGDIASLKRLEDRGGPYGRFRDAYGNLEERTVACGADLVEEALESEQPEHVLRLLRCLERHLDPALDWPGRGAALVAIGKLAARATDADVRGLAAAIVRRG